MNTNAALPSPTPTPSSLFTPVSNLQEQTETYFFVSCLKHRRPIDPHLPLNIQDQLLACNTAMAKLGPERKVRIRLYNLQQSIIAGGRRKAVKPKSKTNSNVIKLRSYLTKSGKTNQAKAKANTTKATA